MYSETLIPTLTILDVGHGNSAILQDQDGVIIIDTGKGPHVHQFLQDNKIDEVKTLLLSHADEDHIGGAITLLLSEIVTENVFLNPDSSKETVAFRQLRYAVLEAEKRNKTKTITSLTTSTLIEKKQSKLEILFPDPSTALTGVGGKSLSGEKLNSNSLSVAIRISYGSSSVLLGGDIGFGCIDYWRKNGITPSSKVLVFPHHGGLPDGCDESDEGIFAYSMAQLVNPEIIIFSIHRTQFNLPRDGILHAIQKYSDNITFACTELPKRLLTEIGINPRWERHMNGSIGNYLEGSIEIELNETEIGFKFLNFSKN